MLEAGRRYIEGREKRWNLDRANVREAEAVVLERWFMMEGNVQSEAELLFICSKC